MDKDRAEAQIEPTPELKPLPANLRYEFLGPNKSFPVIVNASLNPNQTAKLLEKLTIHKSVIGYSIKDLKGISPTICSHRILLEDDHKSSVEHQRRLNPNLKEVVKKEIFKLLDAGIIYPISDSKWVSPVHVVPKKRGATVVKNDKNELIQTRVVIGWCMCIDYRKLNAATRKDHFWNLVTGMQGCQNHHYKGLNISHPVLRCIQRALASSIFTRGETVTHANKKDLMLIDRMLQPKDELERLDLILIMIQHWLEIQRSHGAGGAITLGGYISHMTEHLEYQIQDGTLCRGSTSLDVDSFRLAHFIHPRRVLPATMTNTFGACQMAHLSTNSPSQHFSHSRTGVLGSLQNHELFLHLPLM